MNINWPVFFDARRLLVIITARMRAKFHMKLLVQIVGKRGRKFAGAAISAAEFCMCLRDIGCADRLNPGMVASSTMMRACVK